MSSPWGKIEIPNVNLYNIMSEEVSRDIQEKENQKYAHLNQNDKGNVSDELLADKVLDSDEAIALELQKQFDEDYDEMVKCLEDKYNGTSKISVNFSNYRRAPDAIVNFKSDSEVDEIEDIRDRNDWDPFDVVLKDFVSTPSRGYVKKDGNMVTKDDTTMCSTRNACKLMSYPPEFEFGPSFDLTSCNKVFNRYYEYFHISKLYSKHEKGKRHRIHDNKEDPATDEYTRILLNKMINRQLLKKVNCIISIGKEAVVIHGDCDKNYEKLKLPAECAIKIFKMTSLEFKQYEKYIRDDYRFKDRMNRVTMRKTIELWAEKEMANLVRLKNAGIPCPEVIELKRHILVMSFIGDNHTPAPKLKDVELSAAEYIIAYEQIIEYMKLLYTKGNLIHADLAPYNILWYNDKCYIIDVSQSVEPQQDNAYNFLYRDCDNIIKFFNKRLVPNMLTKDELFAHITGFDYQERADTESHYRFETTWERSKNEANKN